MPEKKLTEKFIKELNPAVEFEGKKGNEIYYSDTVQRGLVLVLNRGGRKSYFYRYNGPNEKQIKKSISDVKSISLEAARQRVRFLNQEIIAGKNPFKEIKDDKAKTFAAVYEVWREWSETHQDDPKSYYKKQSMRDSRGALSFFNDIPLDKIDKVIVEDYQAEKSKVNKAATINRHITELKFLTRWAVDHGIIESHQLDGVKRLPEIDSDPKVHHFTPEERRRFIATVREVSSKGSGGRNMAYLWPLTYILMHTGMRIGSALGLIWSDVDLIKKKILLRAANIKTKKDAIIYISQETADELSKWKPKTTGQPDDHLFPGDGSVIKCVKKQYKRLYARAEMDPKYSVNSLRHDFAMEIMAAGGTVTDAQFMLVHTDPRTTLKYAHPAEDRMRQIADLLEKYKKTL